MDILKVFKLNPRHFFNILIWIRAKKKRKPQHFTERTNNVSFTSVLFAWKLFNTFISVLFMLFIRRLSSLGFIRFLFLFRVFFLLFLHLYLSFIQSLSHSFRFCLFDSKAIYINAMLNVWAKECIATTDTWIYNECNVLQHPIKSFHVVCAFVVCFFSVCGAAFAILYYK